MNKHRLLVSVLACGLAFAPLSANAQLFGPSDEEKAREAAQDSGIQALQGTDQQQDGRIHELEDRVRALTDSLSRAQYSEASAAFRAYADANPGDADLAPQAIYWVGNISFIRQDYAPAARAFAEVIKKYPKSARAPEAMLKLAQSFMSLGQKTEGCTTLGLIKTKYPEASPQIISQAANLRKTACSK